MGCYWSNQLGPGAITLLDSKEVPKRPAGWHRPPPQPSLPPKGRVHGYRKLHVLGRGSTAKVRLCERLDGSRFAMKIFSMPLLRRQRHWDADEERFSDGT